MLRGTKLWITLRVNSHFAHILIKSAVFRVICSGEHIIFLSTGIYEQPFILQEGRRRGCKREKGAEKSRAADKKGGRIKN